MRILFWLAVVVPVLAGGLLVAVVGASPPDPLAEVELAGLGGPAPVPINGLDYEPVVPCDDGDPWTLDQVKKYPDQCVHEDLCVSYDGVVVVQRGASTCTTGAGGLAIAADGSDATACPSVPLRCDRVLAVASSGSAASACVNGGSPVAKPHECADAYALADGGSWAQACSSQYGTSCSQVLVAASGGSRASACGSSVLDSCVRATSLAHGGSESWNCAAHGCSDVYTSATDGSTALACQTFRSAGVCSDSVAIATGGSTAEACLPPGIPNTCSEATAVASAGTTAVAGEGEIVVTPPFGP